MKGSIIQRIIRLFTCNNTMNIEVGDTVVPKTGSHRKYVYTNEFSICEVVGITEGRVFLKIKKLLSEHPISQRVIDFQGGYTMDTVFAFDSITDLELLKKGKRRRKT
jgi:hypothetical protein